MKSRTGRLRFAIGLLTGLSLLVGCTSTQTEKLVSKEQYSGYLSNYSDLTKVETKKGLEYLRWILPDVTAGRYIKVLPQAISFYPKLTPTQKAGGNTLVQIGDYCSEAITRELSADGALATAPVTVLPKHNLRSPVFTSIPRA